MKNLLISQKGSIALISLLIISALLVTLVLSMSEANISSSYQYLNKTSDTSIYNAAEACLEETIIRIEDSTNFPGTTLDLGDISCTSTVAGGETKTILVEVEYSNYVQNFEGQVQVVTQGQANNVYLLNWEKI